MTPGDGSFNEKLDEMLALSRANNRMLKDIRRDALIGVAVKLIVWIAILAAGYYVSVTYFTPMYEMYKSVQGNSTSFQELFEQYRAQFGE